jgi:hypothetical protein
LSKILMTSIVIWSRHAILVLGLALLIDVVLGEPLIHLILAMSWVTVQIGP